MKKFIITQQWPGYDLLDKVPEGNSYAILKSYLIRHNKDGFCFFKDHKTGIAVSWLDMRRMTGAFPCHQNGISCASEGRQQRTFPSIVYRLLDNA